MARFPGDPDVSLTPVLDMKKGDLANVTHYSYGSHAGTHIDPPYHMIAGGQKADEMPADYFTGKAKVFAFLSGKDIDLEDVAALDIKKGDIVLFKTPNSPRMFEDRFYEDYVSLTSAAAAHLVKIGVRAVGIDYLSIEKYENEALETHRILLGAGIPIIEGLNLSDAPTGVYKMTAMFMLVEDSDGVPIRAILEK